VRHREKDRKEVRVVRIAARPHSPLGEIALLAALYGVYEVIRGIRVVDLRAATAHAARIVELEQAVGAFCERAVQEACGRIPLLPDLLALLYPLLHVGVTIGVLVWIYRARRFAYPFVRNALVAMTAAALLVYVAYPVAPPRLWGGGFVDTVTQHGPFDLSSKLLGSLYNPVAAVPSLHFGYALLLGVALAWLARGRAVRAAGAVYPLVVLLVIVGTGNHFLFDALTGAAAALVGMLAALLVSRPAAARGADATPAGDLAAERVWFESEDRRRQRRALRRAPRGRRPGRGSADAPGGRAPGARPRRLGGTRPG
jgi:hypothetical protein